MATNKADLQNIDKSDLLNYPNGRIKDDDGSGNGTPVNRTVYGDIHEFFARVMNLSGTAYNGLPDNITNGYQLVEAFSFLANKNNFIYTLTSVGGILNIDLKLSKLKTDEFLICKSSFNLGAETQIKGSDGVVFPALAESSFKDLEFVRLVKTNGGFIITRLADNRSLDAMTSELLYLKKASYAQEIAGVSDLVATNPLSNILAFVERVNGASSAFSLANSLRNGLYPKEHFTIVEGLTDLVKIKTVSLLGWVKDRKYPLAHGIVVYNKILQVNISLRCEIAEGGYVPGDIINAQPRGADQDGSADYDYGISAKWNETGSANINIFTGDRIMVAYGPTDPSTQNNTFNISDAKWSIRAVILYS